MTLRTVRYYGVIVLAGVVASLVAAASPSARPVAQTARTDDVSKPDPTGDVKAKGLRAGERRAIDIVRVEATGDTFGAIVTVTFAGSFEAAVGRGNLSGAIAGIVLRPRSGRPTVVVTRGPGVRGDDGGGIGRRGPFVVVRQGRSVTFIARNVDFTKIRRLEARTYSTLARTRRTIQQSDAVVEFFRLIAIRPGEDFWEADNREVDPEEHCRNLRADLDEARRRRSEVMAEAKRARDADEIPTASRLDRDARAIGEVIGDLEKLIPVACKPPAEDFGCQARVEKHPTAAGHSNIAVGLCKRTVDRVEVTASAPIQRVDPQGIVVHTTANTFRIVPATASGDRTLAVAIQPPMQPVEFLQVTVQGLTSGTRVTITPFEVGTAGKAYVVVAA